MFKFKIPILDAFKSKISQLKIIDKNTFIGLLVIIMSTLTMLSLIVLLPLHPVIIALVAIQGAIMYVNGFCMLVYGYNLIDVVCITPIIKVSKNIINTIRPEKPKTVAIKINDDDQIYDLMLESIKQNNKNIESNKDKLTNTSDTGKIASEQSYSKESATTQKHKENLDSVEDTTSQQCILNKSKDTMELKSKEKLILDTQLIQEDKSKSENDLNRNTKCKIKQNKQTEGNDIVKNDLSMQPNKISTLKDINHRNGINSSNSQLINSKDAIPDITLKEAQHTTTTHNISSKEAKNKTTTVIKL